MADALESSAGVLVQARYAGFWIRLVAWLIDGIIVGVIGGILGAGSRSSTVGGGLSTLIGLVYLVYFWSEYGFLGAGQTPGMRLVGVRVVRGDGRALDVGRSLLRWLGLVVSFFVIFLGVIWVAFDPRKQGWHDKIADTFVVHA